MGWSRAASAAWEEQASQFGDGNNNIAVSSGDCQNVIVLGTTSGGQGDKAVMWTSSDGGASFAEKAPPQEGMMAFWLDVWMLSADLGFIAGMDFGAVGLRQTTNGGGAWTKVDSASGSMQYSGLFFLPDAQHGWVLGDSGTLFYTEDLTAWQTVSFDDGEAAMSTIHFTNAFEGWMVGGKSETDEDSGEVTLSSEGTVLHSTDGGKTWATLVSGQPYVYSSIWFPTPATGFMTGWDKAGAYLFRSDDHGENWAPVTLPAHPSGRPIIALTSMHFADSQSGWIAGTAGQENGGLANEGVALHTTDGGQTWVHEPGYNGSGGAFFDVWACDPAVAYFVGDGGKIEKWTDGSFVPSEGVPEGSVIGEDGEVVQPLGPWAEVLGGFADGAVPTHSGSTGAPDTTGGGDGGGMPDGVITGTQTVCREEERTEDAGCAVTHFRGERSGYALLLLLLGIGLVWARRQRRRLTQRAALLLPLGLLGAALPGCGGETTSSVRSCETISVQQTFSFDTLGGEDGTTPGEVSEGGGAGSCLIDGEKPSLGDPGPRIAWTNPFLSFARRDGEVDQLVVMDPSSGDELTLTSLDAERVSISATAWSPDRSQIAFLSDYWSTHSTYRANVFALSLDDQGCFMATPNLQEGRLATGPGALRLSGFLKGATGGAGALVPVPDALVASTRGGEVVTTRINGGFLADVPAEDGTLVLRSILRDPATGDERYWGAVRPYTPDNGAEQNLGNAIGTRSGGNTHVDSFGWSSRLGEAGGFLVVRSGWRSAAEGDEAFQELARYDGATGAFKALSLPEDVTEVRSLLQPVVLASGVLVIPWLHKDGSGKLSFVFPDETSATVPAPALFVDTSAGAPGTGGFGGARSRVVVGPHDLLAYVGQDAEGWQLVLLGADGAGELAFETRDVFGGVQPRPSELDWSPGGGHVVVTIEAGADSTDLVEIDVNALTTRALTTDGLSHAPAWYGH